MAWSNRGSMPARFSTRKESRTPGLSARATGTSGLFGAWRCKTSRVESFSLPRSESVRQKKLAAPESPGAANSFSSLVRFLTCHSLLQIAPYFDLIAFRIMQKNLDRHTLVILINRRLHAQCLHLFHRQRNIVYVKHDMHPALRQVNRTLMRRPR